VADVTLTNEGTNITDKITSSQQGFYTFRTSTRASTASLWEPRASKNCFRRTTLSRWNKQPGVDMTLDAWSGDR